MRTWFALFAASIASVVTIAACGARTGLRVDETSVEPIDAGPDVEDAPDAPDAPKPIVNDCEEAGVSYIYLISSENELLRFYPPDLSVTTIGSIDCPTTTPSQPFSMAVDRHGIAYVLFENGELFRVSTLNAKCTATAFVSHPDIFPKTFGMGFSANENDPGESLFVAGADTSNPNPINRLGLINTENFAVAVGAPISKEIGNPELTGTGDARLFAFGPDAPSSHLAEIDKATSAVLSDEILDLQQDPIQAWAFAFWGGEFYFFTSEQPGSSAIHKYTPGGSKSPPLLKFIDGLTIVGAGVSTCAPSE